MSRGEKIAVGITALFLAALAVFLLMGESGGGRYSLSALPEAAPSATPEPETAQLLDLNSATEEELATLPGLGPVRAARIVEYRESHGPYQYIEDVMDVYGIGEAVFDEFRAYVTVNPG